MAYIIDWNIALLRTHLGLKPHDITAAIKILGNVPFDKPRGNEFAPGLHHICYPGIPNQVYGGIDFPCLIHNGDPNRDTIFIVGEAPRRNKYAINPDKPCSLSSPYGIIFKEFPDQCWVYKQVFESLLDKGFNLYLTDADKIWTYSNKLPFNNEGILEDEINGIMHVKIVTLGRHARDMVCRILKRTSLPSECSHLYHPSQRNYERWLKEKGVNNIDDIPKVIVDKIIKDDDMFKP